MHFRHTEDACERDRLERGANDGQLRRLAAVSLMTLAIAHDVDNMLQSVGSVLRMIDRRISHGSPEELAIITADGLHAIKRAAALSKRLTTFRQSDATKQSRVDINAILRDFYPLLRWALGFELHLDLSLADGALETWCNPLDLENAVMNLAINARDATCNGGLFTLQTFRANLPLNLPGLLSGDYVIISAHDSGRGMSPDVMARAFDPFFTTKIAGDGMGLASVKAFVDASGGLADITSRPGEGTTVRLYLPLARPTARRL
jgi:signal transduction histidine kinase